MAEKIPDLVVEQLLLDMLPAAEADDVRAQLLRDDDPRVAALQASNAEILQAYPPDWISDRLRRRLEAERVPTRRRQWITLGGAVAVAAAVLLWWMRTAPTVEPTKTPDRIARADPPLLPAASDDGGVRIKGTERLMIRLKTASGSEALLPGQTVEPGQLVQLAYEPGDAAYGVIASVDGGGAVTLHWPEHADGDTTLGEGTTWLGHSFEFDDAPGFERFVFVTSSGPLTTRVVTDALQRLDDDRARRTAPLELPPGLGQATFLLNKPR